jgi:hypothetical protein
MAPRKGTSSDVVLAPIPERAENIRRDRVGLRAIVQESVHHFTILRRKELARQHYDEFGELPTVEWLDLRQPLMEEYDPVVELGIIAADYRNEVGLRRQANSDAAQYLRPKLSAVAMLDDPEVLQNKSEKIQLARRLVGLMDMVARAKADSEEAEVQGGGTT